MPHLRVESLPSTQCLFERRHPSKDLVTELSSTWIMPVNLSKQGKLESFGECRGLNPDVKESLSKLSSTGSR